MFVVRFIFPVLLDEFGAPNLPLRLLARWPRLGSLAEAAFNLTGLMAGGFIERRGPVIGFAVGSCCFCLGLLGDGIVGRLGGWYVTHAIVGIGMGFADLGAMGSLHGHTLSHVRVGMGRVSYFFRVGSRRWGLQATLLVLAAISALICS